MPGRQPEFVRSDGYKWAVVGLLWVAGFLNAVDRHSIYALFPVLEKELFMSKVQLGLLGSAFLWAYAILGPFSGYVGDRFPRRKVILFSLFAWSATTGLNGLAHSANALLALRVLLAVSEAFYLPTALAMLSDHHTEATRSKAVALHLSAMAIGQVAGGFLGGFMAEHFHWRTLFVILGLTGILWTPLLALTLYPPAERSGKSEVKLRLSLWESAKALSRIATFRSFSLAFLCYSVVGAIVSTWLPYFLFHRFKMSLTLAGFSSNFYLELPTSIGNLLGGVAGDYFATRGYRGRMLTQAGSLVLSAPFFLSVAASSGLTQVATSLVLLGFLRGAWASNVMPVICQIVPKDLRATTYGVMNCLGNVGGGVAAVAAAKALSSQLGMGAAFVSCWLIYWIAAAILIMAAFWQLRRDFRAS